MHTRQNMFLLFSKKRPLQEDAHTAKEFLTIVNDFKGLLKKLTILNDLTISGYFK